jgi:hypothetical protein
MQTSTLQRLATILKRELGASNVAIIRANEDSDDNAGLSWDIGRGKKLVVTFESLPVDLSEKRQRLATLVDSFADLFADVAADVPTRRPEPAEALKAELNALAGRAGATSALIIDAASPIVWSASEAPTTDDAPIDPHVAKAFAHAHEIGISWLELLKHQPGTLLLTEPKESNPADESVRTLRLVPPVDDLAGLTREEREIIGRRAELTINAIARVRKNPVLVELHRGVHLHEAVVDEKLGYLARSFATIYVLLLVFPGQFDELGAERAVVRVLPTIERLVVALPPDDSPTDHKTGAVVALRARRRK